LLDRCAVEGDDFLHSITTGDDSSFYHFHPETKRQLMEWFRTTIIHETANKNNAVSL